MSLLETSYRFLIKINLMQINDMKPKYAVPIIALVLTIALLNIYKHAFIIYLPFNIPGNQMAATIPPFGIFLEPKFKTMDSTNPCKHPLAHELVHWEQYERLGLFSFYYNYFQCLKTSGRLNNWMEREAQRPCGDFKRGK
jgi:hypothetical protein